MLTIFDRYIIGRFLTFFFAGLVVFVSLFMAIDFIANWGRLEAPTAAVAKFFALTIPQVVHQFYPAAVLVATLFTLSTMSRSHELVALMSAGVGLMRICLPFLAVIVLLSASFFWLSDAVLPSLAEKKSFVYYMEIIRKPGLYSSFRTNRIWYRSENMLFNIRTADPQAGTAQGLTLYYFDKSWVLRQLIAAAEVQIQGKTWNLKNGTVTVFSNESSFPLAKPFEEKSIAMADDLAELTATATSPEVQSRADLRQFIARNQAAGLDMTRYRVEYYAKYSFASIALIFALLGIPFAHGRQRSGGGFLNVAICVVVVVVYWSIHSASLAMGKYGYLPPVVSAWVATAVMVLVAGGLLRLTSRP